MANSSLLHWVRVDINWLAHPKARRAGIEGRALWLAGLLWSARMDTDGAIPADVVDLLATEAGILVGIAQESATRLMEAGLWDRTADGWQIHDYEDCQETTVERDMRRSGAAERQRLRRERVTRESRVSHGDVHGPEAEAEAEAEAEKSSSYVREENAPADPPPTSEPNPKPAAAAASQISEVAQRIANTKADRDIAAGKATNPKAWRATLARQALADYGGPIAQAFAAGRTADQIHQDLTSRRPPPRPTTAQRIAAAKDHQ